MRGVIVRTIGATGFNAVAVASDGADRFDATLKDFEADTAVAGFAECQHPGIPAELVAGWPWLGWLGRSNQVLAFQLICPAVVTGATAGVGVRRFAPNGVVTGPTIFQMWTGIIHA